jgi:hypothetical protein
MGLEPTVVEEMKHLDPVEQDSGIGDEPPVTAPPHGLGAHHRHVPFAGITKEVVEGVLKWSGHHVVGIRLPPKAGFHS